MTFFGGSLMVCMHASLLEPPVWSNLRISRLLECVVLCNEYAYAIKMCDLLRVVTIVTKNAIPVVVLGLFVVGLKNDLKKVEEVRLS